MTIEDFLLATGNEEFIALFQSEEITLEIMAELTAADLRAIGLSLGKAAKIISAFKEDTWRASMQSKEEVPFNKDEFPFVLAPVLGEYEEEQNYTLKLWHICDFTELTIRLMVIIAIAELSCDEVLAQKVLPELKRLVEYPTLGKWREMARFVFSEKLSAHYVTLANTYWKIVEPFVSGAEDQPSLIGMRNQLAHGCGQSMGKSKKLCEFWIPHFEAFVMSLETIKALNLYTEIEGDTAHYWRLVGNKNDFPKVKRPLSATATHADDQKHVFVETAHGFRTLWPFSFIEANDLSDEDEHTVIRQNLYVRRGEIALNYTPIGSNVLFAVESGTEALQSFQKLFATDSFERKQQKPFMIRGFEQDFLKDAAECIGRTNERDKIIETTKTVSDRILWIHGNAGAGKSYILSSVYDWLKNNSDPSVCLLGYRFRSGDDRCSKKSLITFLAERLMQWEGIYRQASVKTKDFTLGTLSALLEQIKEDHKVMIVLDGMDELSRNDLSVIDMIQNGLILPHVQWICAGRSNITEKFNEATCLSIFEEGVPPMSRDDVRELLIQKMGRLRKRLILTDVDHEDEVINPFIEHAVRASKGLPIYLKYLVGDILSGKIKAFDGSYPLPQSIDQYYQQLLVQSGTDFVSQLKSPVIGCIAVSKEPVSESFIKAYLIQRDLLIDNMDAAHIVSGMMRTLMMMLRVVSRSDGDHGYILYHHSLYEHLKVNATNRYITESSERAFYRMIKDYQMLSDVLKQYIERWGMRHLIEMNYESALTDLMAFLQDDAFMMRKLAVQMPEAIVDDFYDAYRLALSVDNNGEAIVRAFLKHFEKMQGNVNGISLEQINAFLMYRQDRSFYQNFLLAGVSEEADVHLDGQTVSGMCQYLGGLLRREQKLEDAMQWLQKSLAANTSNQSLLAQTKYEIGYIYYLRGDMATASDFLSESGEASKRVDDLVGYYISYCVLDVYRYHADLLPAEDCLKRLDDAMHCFESHKLTDQRARRWICNLYVHVAMIAFAEKNEQLFFDNYQDAMKNEWFKKYGAASTKQKLAARAFIFKGNHAKTKEMFSEMLNGASLLRTESIAREFLVYGEWLIAHQAKDEGIHFLERSFETMRDNGNLYYTRKAKAILKGLLEGGGI
ncbi:MAG: hypothetical protein PWP51_2960 [Clostridiales bacterium]|nr:hypothetical protein [Clostridiales bacterium]